MEIGEAARAPGPSGPATQTSQDTLELAVRWIDWRRQPLAGWVYELGVGVTRHTGTLPADGIMRVTIPASARQARVRVYCPHSRTLEQLLEAGCCESELRGYLLIDALELPSLAEGAQQRLQNLGYYEGPINEDLALESSRASRWLSLCVRRYQHDENLSETGEINPNTEAALAAAHDEGG